jgi:hypothetical protein
MEMPISRNELGLVATRLLNVKLTKGGYLR